MLFLSFNPVHRQQVRKSDLMELNHIYVCVCVWGGNRPVLSGLWYCEHRVAERTYSREIRIFITSEGTKMTSTREKDIGFKTVGETA